MSLNTVGNVGFFKIVFLVSSSEVSGIVMNELRDRGLALGLGRLEPSVQSDVFQFREVRLAAAAAVVVVRLRCQVVSVEKQHLGNQFKLQ